MHQNARRSVNRKVALTCARAGLFVFPSSSKVPLVLTWQRADSAIGEDGIEEIRAVARKKATAAGRTFDEETFIGCTKDVARVKAMWSKHPDAVPSISLGPSNLYVLDADIDESRHGPTLVRAWLAENDIDISQCPITVSQSGGQHLFFHGSGLRSHIGPTLKPLYVQAKSTGGQVVAPGAIREDGRRYLPAQGQPGLASAYAMQALPVVPGPIQALQAERSDVSTVSDDVTSFVIEAMAGDLPKIEFDPNALVKPSGNCSNDRYALAVDLARSHGADFTPALYRAAIEEFEAAGEHVTDRPHQGQFDDRQLAREFSKAKIAVAESNARRADAMRLDTPTDALAAIEAAVADGEMPNDETERFLWALDDHGMSPERANAARTAVAGMLDALILNDGKAEALALVRAAVTGEGAEAMSTAHDPAADYRERRAKHDARKAPLAWEDQNQSAALMRTQRAEPLVAGVLECGSISVVYGSSNVGKSFVVAGLGFAIVNGLPWHTYAATKGSVVYLGLEGRGGFRQRVAALRQDTAPHCYDPAIFATTQVDGLSLTAETSEANRVILTVREVEAKGGLPVRLVVVDTLAAVIAGSDENSGRDMGAFVGEIKKIAAACQGVHVLIVHHTGKDQAKGARGHSSLRAAVDTEIEITPGEIRVTKQRDMTFIPPIGFRLEPVGLGEDDAGRPLRSAVVRLHSIKGAVTADAFGAVSDSDEDADFARSTLKPEHRTVLDVAILTIEAAGGRPVTPAAIVAEVLKVAPDMKGNTVRTTLRRRLAPAGLLTRVGENYTLARSVDTVL